MKSLKHLFTALVVGNAIFVLVLFMDISITTDTGVILVTPLPPTAVKELKEKVKALPKFPKGFNHKKDDPMDLIERLQTQLKAADRLNTRIKKANTKIDQLNQRAKDVDTVMRFSNPFFLLGAYPKVYRKYFNSYPDGRPFYEKKNYGLINDDDYCEIVDNYNLAHPENMFSEMNFFTDYAKNGLARTKVIREIGTDTMKKVSRYMNKSDFYSAQYHLNPTITNFFTKRVDLHIYHTIGKHFMCATQMYNHIPGHGVLKRKDLIVDSIENYVEKYAKKPQCFSESKFFPHSYRLYNKKECKAFFEEINSEEYKQKSIQEPIQYLMKVGYGAHRAMGVFLLDKNETDLRIEEYDNGRLCGKNNESLIAQKYITNPLLLDLNNKFDFRVYMLVASTNPMMVYYHDGFLRVSLQKYEKHSSDKSVHLTNTHLAKDTFKLAEELGININNMTAQQLRDYQMWTFDKLEDYLLRSGKIQKKGWIEDYLRPAFYQAFIHLMRMSAHAFWKQSNVYELFGLDFMLDDQLNLWFIECNASPQLIGTNELKTNFLVKMLKSLFEIQYGLYKSRMERVLRVINNMQKQSNELGFTDYDHWRIEYKKAAKNRFEKKYRPKSDNTFKLIMDESREGADAYFGHIPKKCVF